MRNHRFTVIVAGMLALACGSDTDSPEPAAVQEGPSVGAVRGTVRDATTDNPLEGVHVSAGGLGAMSDGTGSYGLAPLQPGTLAVLAYLRGFAPESVSVTIEPGVSMAIDFPLTPAAPPCCDLTGVWTAAVALDSAGLNASPASREAAGEIVFDVVPGLSPSSGVRQSEGNSRVDFASLLGPELGSEDDARGAVFAGDSVAITVVPRFADWGVELLGRISGDTISGIWYQRASCCGAYGTFTLLRTAGAE
jgi:hypothetical protein